MMDHRFLIQSKVQEHKVRVTKINQHAYKLRRVKQQVVKEQRPSFIREFTTFFRAVFH